MALNQLTDVQKLSIAPTDSRLRPDIRSLEEGDIGNVCCCRCLASCLPSVVCRCSVYFALNLFHWFSIVLVPVFDVVTSLLYPIALLHALLCGRFICGFTSSPSSPPGYRWSCSVEVDVG